ncbi:MAG: hypothetical protein HY238_10835 [Acidobacteria bacterium]|nr:hypothetical protein [Acidobacteriota bacterium]
MRPLAVLTSILVLFSSTLWAADSAFVGTLRPSGVVLANAMTLPDGGTVRSGDSITTQPAALAVISSPSWGRLEVRFDSEARLASDRVLLARGAVVSSRLPVEVAGFTVRPENPAHAWFAVAQRNGRLVVAAHRGNLLIASTGALPVLVPEGSVASQGQEQDQPPEPEKGKKKRAAAAASGGWTIGSLSHAASIALLIAVGAAAAAAVAGLSLGGGKEATPSPSF